MAKKQSKNSKGDEDKLFAVLCYLISIIGVVLVLATKKDRDKQSIYHAKQGLVLFIVEILVSIVWTLLAWIPFIGWFVGYLLWIGALILAIVGIINVINNKMVPLPLIGQYGNRFNF